MNSNKSLYCLVALALLTANAAAGEPRDEPAYQAAMARAAKGQVADAAEAMAQLAHQFPDQPLYLHEAISLLERAGRYADALALGERVERDRAPAYVLESLAGAAAGVQRFDLASDLYVAVLKRHPGRKESLQGLASAGAQRVVVSGGLPPFSQRGYDALTPADAHEVMALEAAQLEGKGLFYAALQLDEDILRLSPDDRRAQAALIRISARLGATHQAVRLAAKYPDVVDAQLRDRLTRDRTAVEARWAERQRSLPGRHLVGTARLDAAIVRTDDLAQRFLASDAPMSEAQLAWLHDRIVLLGMRRRARDVVALHDRFARRGLPLPGYVLGTVAGAYLQLHQPTRASALYERVLREDPNDADARVGMYFALLESEAHEQAYAWIDDWVKAAGAERRRRDDADSKARLWEARLLQARSREYAGEPAVAQRLLEDLQAEAPNSGGVRSAMASVYRARGWPRRAWDTWQLQLLHDGDDVDARAQSVGALLDTYRFGMAREQLSEAQARQPDAPSVARSLRDWQLHERPELTLGANLGRSNDTVAPNGTRDDTVDAYLFSRPFAERYRLFVHGHYAQADLADGYGHYNRAGAGLEYRAPDLRLTGELHAGIDGDGAPGLLLGGRWWMTDVWNVAANVDTRTQDIPLKARGANIDAKRAQVELEARLNESRAFAAALGGYDFSDDNRRRFVQASWREGLLMRPRYNLAARIDLYASRNSRSDAPYFNPSSDRSASASLTGAWRTYRRYEREFVQEMTLSAGNYWQEGFGSGATWGIEYAHRWQLHDGLSLRYAVGHTQHPYDGEQSGRSYLTLDMDWKF